MDYTRLTDDALIQSIASQKPDALGELYNRYSRLIFSIAYNSVGSSETAEEITQDVFLRVWRRASTYDPDKSKVSTWLTSITRYRAIDVLRRWGVRVEQNSIPWDSLTTNQEPLLDSNPEEKAAETIRLERIRAEIAALPPEQQQALALAYFQGLTHSEIAEVLGDPLGTVKTRIRLGMQKLREALVETREL